MSETPSSDEKQEAYASYVHSLEVRVESQQRELETLRAALAEAQALNDHLRGWCDAEVPAEQELETLRGALRELVDGVKTAIRAGDWVVDGACDPERAIATAIALLPEEG